MQFSFYDIILILGIVQGCVGSSLLIFNRQKDRSNRILGYCVFVVTLALVKLLIHTLGLWDEPFFSYFPLSIELFPPVLIYLYAQSLITPEEEKIPRFKLMLLPGVLMMIHAVITYMYLLTIVDPQTKSNIANEIFLFRKLNALEDILSVVLLLIFIIPTYKILSAYIVKLREYAVDKYVANLRWLIFFLIAMIVSVVISIIAISINSFTDFALNNFWHDQIQHGIYALFLYVMAFYAYQQVQMPSIHLLKADLDFTIALNDEDLSALFNKVNDHMQSNKPYLNSELSLPQLATTLNTKTYLLSKSIKQATNQTFRNYLNEFRVKEVLVRMKDHDLEHLTLLGLAYESGFNSEASFYRVFKNHTGMSPKQYRTQL